MVKDCTGERLAKIETTLEYLKEEQNKQGKMLEAFIASADNRYASKIIERAVFAVIAFIVLGVIGAIVKLVII